MARKTSGSIPGRVRPKTKKIVLDAVLDYKVRIKGEWSYMENGVALHPIARY